MACVATRLESHPDVPNVALKCIFTVSRAGHASQALVASAEANV